MTETKAVKLRAGDGAAPIFLFSGVDCELTELRYLVESVRPGRALYGMRINFPSNAAALAATVEHIGAQAVMEIRARQLAGPYHLVGYSFGGLLAFEAARLLHDAGAEVGLVALVGSRMAQRYWPLSQLLASVAKRTRRHVGDLASRPIGAASLALASRALRFAHLSPRELAPRSFAVPPALLEPRPPNVCGGVAAEAYRPGFFPGIVTLIQSADDLRNVCDLGQLWRGHTATHEIYTIATNHASLLNEPAVARLVAQRIDAGLDIRDPQSAPGGLDRRVI